MEKQVHKAAFRLEKFAFPVAKLDLEGSPKEITLENIFSLTGVYDANNGEFRLSFVYKAQDYNSKKNIVEVKCQSIFRFSSLLEYKEIPDYFYQNSIAILFPYVRAFVSSLTLQANVPPIVLDTLNLSPLSAELKKNTRER